MQQKYYADVKEQTSIEPTSIEPIYFNKVELELAKLKGRLTVVKFDTKEQQETIERIVDVMSIINDQLILIANIIGGEK